MTAVPHEGTGSHGAAGPHEVRSSDHLGRLELAIRGATRTGGEGHSHTGADGVIPGDVRRSAVLALISDTDSPDILLTRRNAHLRHHAGQVSLPGGRAEPQDADIVETALREAHEEVGLPPEAARVIGTLPATLVAVSSNSVTTVVASWDGVTPLGVVDPGEVAGVRRVAMSDLADPDNRAQARHPRGFRGPAFLLEDLFVWGFTAQLLSEILDRGGWSRPWDRRRVVEIPAGYLGRTLTS